MSALISVQNLTRRYAALNAVDDISFELSAGDILGFLGPNGAGKSTTMQMLSGTLAPTYGEIRIDGHDLLEQPKAAKACLGYLPDTPPLYKEMTVSEYLRFCARLRITADKGRLSVNIKAACDDAIERCSLGDVRHRVIRNLSKGYQQRVGIAQAILHSPPVIILDEPTVGLDPIQIREIRQLIKTLGESHGIILSTHILPEVQAICNRVQIIHQGKLVYRAAMDDIQHDGSVAGSSRIEISLSTSVSTTQLLASEHEGRKVFTAAEIIADGHYLLTSTLDAQHCIEHLVDQHWGLTSFTPQQSSLEQIFIDLTVNEASTGQPAADVATETQDDAA